MKLTIRAILLCLFFHCQATVAAQVDHLFESEVIARTQLEKDRLAAIRKALAIVLKRVLVGDNIEQDETVKRLTRLATDYVQEYQYSLVFMGDSEDERLMRVKFNENLLVADLRRSKLGFWNEIRPTTLVWLVIDKDRQLSFFDANAMSDIDKAMQIASRQTALPIIYPMLDLEEKKVISISDVLSAYSDHLLDVSLRYDVVSTLAGKIVHKGVCWKAEWTLYFDAKIRQWRSPCESLEKVALNGLYGVYKVLSGFYAVNVDPEGLSSSVK